MTIPTLMWDIIGIALLIPLVASAFMFVWAIQMNTAELKVLHEEIGGSTWDRLKKIWNGTIKSDSDAFDRGAAAEDDGRLVPRRQIAQHTVNRVFGQ